MPKNFFQDMVNIKRERKGEKPLPPENLAPKPPAEPAPDVFPREPARIFTRREEQVINYQQTGEKKSRHVLWFVALVCVLFLFFALSFFFARATVAVNPKIQNLTLNENLSAAQNSDADLPFDLVTLSDQATKTVIATGKKSVSNKATGQVSIFNAFSATAQKLNINTRLQGSNGKIYKNLTATTVPGEAKDGTPGSVEVSIYADAAGASYNSSPLDFTLVGFKGTSKYAKIYGRSVGSIAGGFVGTAPTISEADQAVAVASLQTALQTKLFQKAEYQIPTTDILFKSATFFTSTDNNAAVPVLTADNTFPITVSGTLYGIFFNQAQLTKKIAKDNVPNYDGSDVYIPDIQNLTFALAPATVGALLPDFSNLQTLQSINFNLSGNAKLVWKVDQVKLTDDLLGKNKSAFNPILALYANIDSATSTLTPVWVRSFPDKAKNIKIIVNYPTQ